MQAKYQLLLVFLAASLTAGVFHSTPMNAGAAGQGAAVSTPADSVVLPKAIQKVQPIYPDEVVRRGIEATIYLFVFVDEEGYVVKADLDTARTFFSHPGEHKIAKYEASLTKSAKEAVMKWRFKPGRVNGKPSAMEVIVPIQFQLADMQSGVLGMPPSFVEQPPVFVQPRGLTDENGSAIKQDDTKRK